MSLFVIVRSAKHIRTFYHAKSALSVIVSKVRQSLLFAIANLRSNLLPTFRHCEPIYRRGNPENIHVNNSPCKAHAAIYIMQGMK
jgi:hypothetical protein